MVNNFTITIWVGYEGEGVFVCLVGMMRVGKESCIFIFHSRKTKDNVKI